MTTITEIRRPIEDLSLAQIDQEVRTRFTQAESLIKEHKDDEARAIMDEIDQFEMVRSRKESREQMVARVQAGVKQYKTPAEAMIHVDHSEVAGKPKNERKSLGQLFSESKAYRAQLENGLITPDMRSPVNLSVMVEKSLIAERLERRAIITGLSDTSTGAFIQPDYQPGYLDLRQRMLTLLDLIPRIPTSSDLISYVEQTGFTNAAAFVAEATATTGTSGTKPESDLAFVVRTKPVETLAHWVAITTRALADWPMMRTIIDGQLMLGVDLALEAQVITGNGSTPNIEGILTNASVQTQALGSDNAFDALFKAMTKVMVTGLAMPNAFVLNPLNWQTIRLARENASTGVLGQYLFGPPSVAGAATLWGLPVVLSMGLTANTALVGEFTMRTLALFDREQTVLRTGYVGDDFIRNMLRILAEMRAAFAIFRPTAIAKVTGLS